MTIHETNRFGDKRDYTVVDSIPDGYEVWNIGGIEGMPYYMPLCICYSGTYTVQLDKLLAIKVPETDRKVMEKCSMRTGAGNLAEAKRLMKCKHIKKETLALLELAMPLFEKYTKKEG